ncbi:hypothetical protein [Lactococcus garvieae]|jgi:hypothetical protein|nr:hypothetical protein [Lactococcus garvieae]QPS70348.1 hypothetical protein I6G50_06075 [Lactococcus garvieae]
MLKSRFYSFMFGTIIEAWIFSIAFFEDQWFWLLIASFLLGRRIYVAYKVDKFVKLSNIK